MGFYQFIIIAIIIIIIIIIEILYAHVKISKNELRIAKVTEDYLKGRVSIHIWVG